MTNPIDLKGPVPNFVFSSNALLAPLGVVTQALNHANPVHRIQLQLDSVRIVITDALAYGGVLLGYLPNTNLIWCGGEMNLTWVKDGTGIVTGELPKLALGSAAASNATLSTTMQDLINGGAGGTAVASGLTGSIDIHSADNATPALVFLTNSATKGVYLNAAVNPTGDGYITVSGTIDMRFISTGNVNT